MAPPSWRTVVSWLEVIIDTHTKVSYKKKNTNGKIPVVGVTKLLEDMARAADHAGQLERENRELKQKNDELLTIILNYRKIVKESK